MYGRIRIRVRLTALVCISASTPINQAAPSAAKTSKPAKKTTAAPTLAPNKSRKQGGNKGGGVISNDTDALLHGT